MNNEILAELANATYLLLYLAEDKAIDSGDAEYLRLIKSAKRNIKTIKSELENGKG